MFTGMKVRAYVHKYGKDAENVLHMSGIVETLVSDPSVDPEELSPRSRKTLSPWSLEYSPSSEGEPPYWRIVPRGEKKVRHRCSRPRSRRVSRSRSPGIMGSVRVGSSRFDSGRAGSGHIFKGMKVRAYISMVKMTMRSQLEKPDPNREHVVSSVNEGANELKKD